MVSNLAGRGIELQTLRKYGSLEVQRERLRLYGFRNAVARDVDELWECVGEEEKERVGRLEMVDEVEEWTLLARHYCVAWGWRNGEEGENEETQENGAEREDKSGAKDRSNRDDDLDKIEEVWDMWDGIWEQEKS